MGPGFDFFVTLLMLFLAASGGPTSNGRPNDLLDLVPTASYWRVKGVTVSREQLESELADAKPDADIPKLVKDLESLRRRDDAKKQLAAIGTAALEDLRAETRSPDPEASAMAQELLDSIVAHGKETAVRRLMAIRTLGERKEKDSEPLLKKLLDSKEMFVAEYAERAIATIEGLPVKTLDHHAEVAADLNLLPAGTGLIGQTTGLGMPGLDLAKLLDLAGPPADAHNAQRAGANDAAVDRLTKSVLEYAEQVGNVRADGLTIALSADIGSGSVNRGIDNGTNEWATVIVRGQYDREAVAQFILKMNGNRGVIRAGADQTALSRQGDIISISLDREAMIYLPSDKQLIFLVANPQNTPIATISAPMLEAATTGRPNTLEDNKELAALLKNLDKSGPLWIAGIPSPVMKSVPALAAFHTVTLSVKEDKDSYLLTATGRGSGDAVAARDQIMSVQQGMLGKLKQAAEQMKELKPLVDGMESLKVTVEDAGATATAKVPRDVMRSVLTLMVQSMPGLASPPDNAPPGIIRNRVP